MSIYASLRGLLIKERRRSLGLWWIFLNIAYDAVRSLIVTTLFARHGVNGLYYLSYCLVFSAFFGYFSFKLILAFVDDKPSKLAFFAVLSGLTFFAPDLYVIVASHDVPKLLYVSLATYLVVTSSVTAYSLRKKALQRKELKLHPES